MITEAEARDAAQAALPETSFVRRYVEHATKNTTAPIGYHLASALAVLATTVPVDYGMHYAGKLRSNMFCLLVGRSGEDQKSTALTLARELLFDAASPLVGDFPGSAEGLIDSLARQPTQMVPISEFGKFLSAAQKGYYEPIKSLLADLWDSQPCQRAKANGKITKCDNPRLSMLAACSMPYLEKYSSPEDWSGGFMGRWAVILGQRERTDPDPIGDMSGYDALKADVYERATSTSAGWCMGLDNDARDLWFQWYTDITNRDLPSNIVGVRARAPTIARKVALLYGWDFGSGRGTDPWRMGIRELIPAIMFAELHVKSIIGLAGHICEHADARMRRSVIETLLELGGESPIGAILGRLKMRRRPVMEALDALIEEGVVIRHNYGEGIMYGVRRTE